MTTADITFYIRLFNTIFCLGLLIHLIYKFQRRKVYLKMNLIYIGVLMYIAGLFIITNLLRVTSDPVFSAIGASLNILAITSAIASQGDNE